MRGKYNFEFYLRAIEEWDYAMFAPDGDRNQNDIVFLKTLPHILKMFFRKLAMQKICMNGYRIYTVDFQGTEIITCVDACGKCGDDFTEKQRQMFEPMLGAGFQYFTLFFLTMRDFQNCLS